MGAKDTALKDEYSARQNLTDEEYRELEAEPES